MLKKLSLIAIGLALLPGMARAAVNLKKVNVAEGGSIELLFDGKIDPSQVKTEFVRDNIQLSLSNTSVYPAKVSMVSGSELTKVFAYQYSPALVRARFTVKGDAQSYANRLQVKISGKTITLRLVGAKTDQVATTTASALRTVSAPEKSVEQTGANLAKEAEQKELLERIASAEREKNAEKAAAKAAEKSESKSDAKEAVRSPSGKREPLAGGKPLPSPFRSIGVMLFVLGMFGLFVLFLKRVKGEGKAAKAAKGGLGGFLNKLSGGATNKAMIEVVATHHLAPKRSIVVVRVQDRMLVLGMTNDSVNLITEFRANEEGEAEENIGIGDFAASLKKFENEDLAPAPSAKVSPKANLGDIAAAALGLAKPKPASAPKASAAANAYQSTSQASAVNAAAGATAAGGPTFSPALAAALSEPSVKPSIRAQIKDRVQGMKPL
ncbi:MAG: flagellar biosynthetic protein FliO [Bdellovibrionales bacterium]|nr:flagellar biosynthetic protein FliO [Bdellovibrionales bacterium]